MPPLLQAIKRAVADSRTFGIRFHLRHLSRLTGAPRDRVPVPGGGDVWLRRGTTDVEVFRQVYQWHEYDLGKLGRYRDIRAHYDALLADGHTPVIVDAGANIGIATLWFARMFPRAHIVAVEPEPANAAMCRANTSANPAVTVVEAGIGSSSGQIALHNPAGEAWSPRSARSDDGGIDIVTIDEIVAALPAGRLFIVKIDIEGFESDLFDGNVDWIDAAKLLIIELHDWMLPGGATSFALQRAMGARRFEMVISGENMIYYNTESTMPPVPRAPVGAPSGDPAFA